MFQKLRLKLTIVNVAVILSLFIILIVGAYFVSRYDMDRRSTFVMERIMADLQAGMPFDMLGKPPGAIPGMPPGAPPGPEGRPPVPPPPGLRLGPDNRPPGERFFFVEASPTGTIVRQSANQPLAQNSLETLTAKALLAADQRGTVRLESGEYSYLRQPLKADGQAIVFHDLAIDKEMQLVLLTALMIVGAACTLLSFGASFIMAERAMQPVRQTWQQQKDFLSDASHELRSPLAVIQTTLDVVRLKPEETIGSQEKWLDNIQEEVASMAKLVESLLFLARAESAQQVLHKQPFDYAEALLRAVGPFETVAAARGVTLVVAAGDEAAGCGDEARIRQVIGILLDNAIRHTPAGGKVTASLAVSDSRAVLSVTDTGEGIEPGHLDKIFDRFYQVDKARAKGGAGLGLAIAKWIVERHGGAISVASTPGQGATFSFWLPLEKG
jgi:two-component system sensor histidine kinase CiaH